MILALYIRKAIHFLNNKDTSNLAATKQISRKLYTYHDVLIRVEKNIHIKHKIKKYVKIRKVSDYIPKDSKIVGFKLL